MTAYKNLNQPASEESYRSVIEHMQQGFCIIEMKFDSNGQAMDYYFLETNPVFEKQTGLKNARGKSMRQLQPEHEDHWFALYGQVVKTRQPIHFEQEAAHLAGGVWYEVYAFPFGASEKNRVVILFNDITARKLSEKRQSFLLRLSDALRSTSDSYEIQTKACQLLGQHLNVDRAYFAEINEAEGWVKVQEHYGRSDSPSMAGTHRLVDYGWSLSVMRRGETIVFDDVQQTELVPEGFRPALKAIHIIAHIAVPIIRDNVLVGILCISEPMPRKWTELEISLMHHVADQLWEAFQRGRAEAALRESEDHLRTTLEGIDETFYVLDKNLHFLYASNAALQMWRKKKEDVFGREFLKAFPQAAGSKPFKAHLRVMQTGVSERFETVSPVLNRWIEVKLTPTIRGGLSVAFWDIEDRKQAEEALRLSEEKYRHELEKQVSDRTAELREQYALQQTMLDTTLIGMSVFQPVRNEAGAITDFRIIIVNKKIERSSGRTDMVGKLYGDLFPGIKQMGLFDCMIKTIETGEPQKMEYHYTYDGVDRWYSTMFVKGEDILVSTNLDITERKQSEDERFRNYLLLQQSEEFAGIGSWDYDLLTGVFTWSDGMYRLFDLNKGTEVQPEIYIQYATDGYKEAARRIVTHIKKGDAEFDETIQIQVDKKIKVLKLKATLIKNAEGHPVRVLGVDIDVTASRQAEEKMRRMEAEQQLEIFRVILHTQEEERRRISESLHNGLGQMLYGVKMSLSQLTIRRAAENPGEFESARRYTSELLSDAIRDTRRISHELMPAVLEEFGLRAAVHDACQQMQDGVIFRCSIDIDDSQIDKYMQLAIFRTLQELMLNVVKHAKATEAEADIKGDKEYIMIRVRDNGRGMNTDMQGKTGIGLASIRSKADLLNGQVVIQSAPGKGTSVTVRLPYIPQKAI